MPVQVSLPVSTGARAGPQAAAPRRMQTV